MIGAALLVFGIVRAELTALIWGSAFLGAQVYAFLAVTATFLPRRGSGYLPRASLSPMECGVGDPVSVSATAPRRPRFPAVEVSYSIPLRSADGRTLEAALDPERGAGRVLSPTERGAFFAPRDRLVVEDVFGFFKAVRSVPAEPGTRLTVLPTPVFGVEPEFPAGGGTERRTARNYDKTEDLTESRKYNPGDDPRRINWKLYGHSGELFVREGESEPPPRSVVTVLVDGGYDPALYSLHTARETVDELASRAVALVSTLLERGFAVNFGSTSSPLATGSARDAAVVFSAVAARPLGAESPLPNSGEDSLIVFANPRDPAGIDPLRTFVAGRGASGNPSAVYFLRPSHARTGGEGRPRWSWRRALFRTAPPVKGGQRDWFAVDAVLAGCLEVYGGMRGVRTRRIDG